MSQNTDFCPGSSIKLPYVLQWPGQSRIFGRALVSQYDIYFRVEQD